MMSKCRCNCNSMQLHFLIFGELRACFLQPLEELGLVWFAKLYVVYVFDTSCEWHDVWVCSLLKPVLRKRCPSRTLLPRAAAGPSLNEAFFRPLISCAHSKSFRARVSGGPMTWPNSKWYLGALELSERAMAQLETPQSLEDEHVHAAAAVGADRRIVNWSAETSGFCQHLIMLYSKKRCRLVQK